MDRKKVVEGLLHCTSHDDGRDKFGGVGKCGGCPYYGHDCTDRMKKDALALLEELQQQIWEFQDQVEYLTDKLKEHESLLGIQQTADSITFVSTGTAQQGESRGLLLGRYAMYEWLKKELFCRGLLTDDIKAVFDEAKLQESR